MTGAITWEALAYFAGLAVLLGGVVAAFYRRIWKVEEMLSAFKLIVTEHYIRNEHLERLEQRHSSELSRLTYAIESLSKRIDAFMAEFKR